jgi:hypothetical protein
MFVENLKLFSKIQYFVTRLLPSPQLYIHLQYLGSFHTNLYYFHFFLITKYSCRLTLLLRTMTASQLALNDEGGGKIAVV